MKLNTCNNDEGDALQLELLDHVTPLQLSFCQRTRITRCAFYLILDTSKNGDSSLNLNGYIILMYSYVKRDIVMLFVFHLHGTVRASTVMQILILFYAIKDVYLVESDCVCATTSKNRKI
jgi:hypothetical protein